MTPHESGLQRLFPQLAPFIFVGLWSTGFIGAKFGLPYAPPLTFLALRFVIVIGLLLLLVLVLRAPWPTAGSYRHAAVSGLLLHAGYLGGVFVAIHQGLSAGLSALIVGMQPILTALLAGVVLGEQVNRRQWFGLGLGLVGVALVVSEKLSGVFQAVPPWGAWAAISLALVSSTAGTLYQKQYGSGIPLLSGTIIQYLAAGIATGIGALSFETVAIQWTTAFMLAMAWLVLALSLGAILLLLFLIRRNSAARVSSLFYLVPPVTAIQAYLLFNERLNWGAIAGLVVAIVGVALVTMQPLKQR
jgi:drug/metabolite transporter (DMT)-like permease